MRDRLEIIEDLIAARKRIFDLEAALQEIVAHHDGQRDSWKYDAFFDCAKYHEERRNFALMKLQRNAT